MTKLDWMITVGPPTITFYKSSILSLPQPSHLQWPLSWQLEVPKEPSLSLGTESSPYPSIPIQASMVTFALEIPLDRDYFLWHLHDGSGPGACVHRQPPTPLSLYKGYHHPAEFQGTVQGNKDFVSIFL